jgi:glycolate oxidase FAD binding subunit
MSAALGSPYEVTAAIHLRGGGDVRPEAQTIFRLEGFAGSVTYRAAALAQLLAPFGARQGNDEPHDQAAFWRRLRDLEPYHAAKGDVWRLSVKASDAARIVAQSGAIDAIYDWGGGLVWLLSPEGSDLRNRLGAFQGHATLIRGSIETRTRIAPFQPEPVPLAAISAGLRARFDPKGVFNPGLMG